MLVFARLVGAGGEWVGHGQNGCGLVVCVCVCVCEEASDAGGK